MKVHLLRGQYFYISVAGPGKSAINMFNSLFEKVLPDYCERRPYNQSFNEVRLRPLEFHPQNLPLYDDTQANEAARSVFASLKLKIPYSESKKRSTLSCWET
jgi:hypothetical protein